VVLEYLRLRQAVVQVLVLETLDLLMAAMAVVVVERAQPTTQMELLLVQAVRVLKAVMVGVLGQVAQLSLSKVQEAVVA
jgi:hypothetical protein